MVKKDEIAQLETVVSSTAYAYLAIGLPLPYYPLTLINAKQKNLMTYQADMKSNTQTYL